MYRPKDLDTNRDRYHGMTVVDLIAKLEDLADTYGNDTPIRLMTQPTWPFEHQIADVVASDQVGHDEDREYGPEETEDGDPADEEVPVCLYILEGTYVGYGTQDAWNEV